MIADKRILRVHNGTTSVNHDKIIDPEVDAGENLLIRTVGQLATPEILLACRDVPAEPAPSRSGSSSCFDRFKERRRGVRWRLAKMGGTGRTMMLTIGLAGDGSFVVGANGELGIALDLNSKRAVRGCRTGGVSVGLAGGAGGGVGVWFDYSKKGRFKFGNLIGVSMNTSIGLSAEAVDYNRVRTKVF